MILKIKAARTPYNIICFLFFGVKFAAIRPIIIALSAAIIISMRIICINITDCSINLTLLYLIYKKIQLKVVKLNNFIAIDQSS